MMIYPVQTAGEAYDACHPEEALKSGDPRYVDLTSVRGGENLARIVAWRIGNTRPPRFHQQLISGHRGCGKSTELRQLQARLRQDGFFAIYLDAEDALDLGEITYQDVLIAIARAVDSDLREAGLKINAALLKELDEWLVEKFLTEEQKEDVEGTLRAEFGVEAKVPLLARMLAAITSQIKSASSRRVEIRRKLEQELGVFIQRLNILLGEARRAVIKKNYRDLVILVDGLEKMQYLTLADGQSNYSILFVHHAEQLKAPQCHIVYTIPISLVFNANLGDAFSDSTIVLPMVDHSDDAGREKLRQVISQRVGVEAVFESGEIINQLIEMSGGSMRDLMRLVRISCEGVAEKIAAPDAERAVRTLVREFDRLLRDEDLDGLMDVARTRRISGDKHSARLLDLRLVHEYQNDERWADLHPAVRQVPRVRERLKELSHDAGVA